MTLVQASDVLPGREALDGGLNRRRRMLTAAPT
jgi:hypothetical protein